MNKTFFKLLVFALLSLPCARVAQAGSAEPASDGKPVTFPLSYTGEGLANLSGGYKRGAIYEGLLSAGVQLDLEKLAAWKGATALISAIYPHGPSLTERYVHDFNGVSSIDAYDSVRLYETWLQQEFADGKLSIRLGQLLADTEFFVSENGALFVNGAFGAIPLVSKNFEAPVYPVAAPGVRARFTQSEAFAVQVGVFDGNVGDPATENQHGLHWNLNADSGVLALAEAAYSVNSQKESQGLRGVYKFGLFYHTPSKNDEFLELPRHANAGGYFIADQQLWRKPGSEDGGLGGFLRVGGAPSDRNVVSFYGDAGLNFKGTLPGREKDIAGIGVSYTKLSEKLRDETNAPLDGHFETILEMTYRIIINEKLSVQPDFQYIFNPGASHKLPNAVVAGLRFNLTL